MDQGACSTDCWQKFSDSFSLENVNLIDKNPFIVSVTTFFLIIFSLATAFPQDAQAQSIFDSFRAGREYQTAIGLLQNQELDLAEKQFRKLIKKYSSTEYLSKSYFGLAETHYIRENYDQSSKFYYKSLSEGETLPGTLRQSALKRGLESVRFSDNEYKDELLTKFEEFPRENITSSILLEVVRLNESEGKRQKALRKSREGLKLFDYSDTWIYESALLETRTGNFDTGLSLLNKIEGHAEYADHVNYLQGEIHLQRSELKKASENYDEVSESSEFHHDAIYGLAWVNIKRENYLKSSRQLKQTFENDTNLKAETSRDLARIFRRLNQPDTAVSWYKEAIERNSEPIQSKLRIELADYYVNRDQLSNAIPLYESAKSLQLQSQKSLIEAYINENRYKKALELIEKNKNEGSLKEDKWNYYQGLSLYHTGKLTNALQSIPDSKTISDTNLKSNIWRLKGRIYFDQEQYNRARTIYETWHEESNAAEARYYIALMFDKSGDRNRAKEIWRTLSEKELNEPWESRIHHQLARIYYDNSKFAKFREHESKITRKHLTDSLRIELSVMETLNSIRQKGPNNALFQAVENDLKEARDHDMTSYWYGKLLSLEHPETWWNDLLKPVLLKNETVQEEWALDSLRILRNREKVKSSYELGKRLLKRDPETEIRIGIQINQIQNLQDMNRNQKISKFIPRSQFWEQLNDQQLYALGLGITNYYRAVQKNEKGREMLKKLRNTVTVSSSLDRLIDEWIASFEVDEGLHEEAKNRLDDHSYEDLTNSGRLNFAIANYYTGNPQTSLENLQQLRTEWERPPHELYQYGFRFARSENQDQKLIEWTQEFETLDRFPDTTVLDLLVENAQYWIQRKKRIGRALDILQSLEQLQVASNEKLPVIYYQAIGFFNRSDLKKVFEVLDRFEKNFSLNKEWKYRAKRTRIETNLRLDNWEQAYVNWQKLNQMDRGGEVGTRLLSENALRDSPEKFKSLLKKMSQNYSDYLSESDRHFWWGRYHDLRGNLTEAVRHYETYLEGDQESRRIQVRVQLARLYQTQGQTESALEQFKTLRETTGGAKYLRPISQLQMELDRYEQAEETLQRSLRKIPNKKDEIRHNLANLYYANDESDKAYKNYRLALEGASETVPWKHDVRVKVMKMALNRNEVEKAQEQVEKLETGPVKKLFKAEFARRANDYDLAGELLDSFRKKFDTVPHSEIYSPLAVAVYDELKSHEKLIQVLPEVPANPEDQILKLRSLLNLNKRDKAAELYAEIDKSMTKKAARMIGDYNYNRGNWRSALGYYQETHPDIRVSFRIGNIFRKIEEPEKAFSRWNDLTETLEQEEAEKWSPSILSGLRSVTKKAEKRTKAAKMIKKNWRKFSTVSDTASQLGLKWSSRPAFLPEHTGFYLDKVDTLSDALFVNLAEKLHEQDRWGLLRQLTRKVDPSEAGANSIQHAYFYYKRKAKHETGSDSVAIQKLTNNLDRAVRDTSAFAPKLQRLLADAYYERGQYEEAAIGYRKVEILFEDNPEIEQAKLGLARSHMKRNHGKKARKIFQKLSKNSDDKTIKKEAEEWLTSKKFEE